MRDYEEITAFLGEWGPFQRFIFLLLSASIFPNGFCGMSIIFVGDIPEYVCLIPENLNLSQAWMNKTIPLVQKGSEVQYSRCRRYRLESIVNLSLTIPDPDLFNVSQIEKEPCLDGWVYSKEQYISTIVTEWDLVCNDDWKAPLSMSFFFAGVLIGSFVSGQLPDRSWRMLFLTLSLSGLMYIPMWWFIPESPRWLMLKGRVKEAEEILRFIAKKNGVTAPDVLFTELELEDMRAKSTQSYAIIHLVRTYNIRIITIINILIWMILTTGYFGLSLNTPNLHGDDYLNCFFLAAIEVPASTAAWIFLQRCSRRVTLSSILLIGGALLIVIQFIPTNISGLATVLVMSGKLSTTCGFDMVYVYTAELYPTAVRNMGVGVSSMASRLGSIISPYIFYLGVHQEFLPFTLIGILSALSGTLVLFLPETFNAPLPDTVDQMQKIKGFKCSPTHKNHFRFNKKKTSTSCSKCGRDLTCSVLNPAIQKWTIIIFPGLI
ncbi:solute carrier family 22 member 5-like [Amblyraja radiata]|uniref:solute carrier family 22 member 5-like n=1 Tax=Amblyraja radiata TaxID=386614 RepID=UPI001401C203|nr:solute carrier family 22 member 5-like [Amblyraja radiata]